MGMRAALVAWLPFLTAGSIAFGAIGCLRFSEDPARIVDDDAGDATVADAATDLGIETSPTMCDRYGGFATVEKATADLVAMLAADCRVDRFFVGLSPESRAHMQECMALQIGSIMQCSREGVRVKYPALDSKGALCRDMKTSHQGLGIHDADFDALIDDTLAVLSKAAIAGDDLALLADVLRFQRADIVNPGDAGRGDACASEASTDTGVDTGDDY